MNNVTLLLVLSVGIGFGWLASKVNLLGYTLCQPPGQSQSQKKPTSYEDELRFYSPKPKFEEQE